jgi:Putative prokaryotic signal transducing protein
MEDLAVLDVVPNEVVADLICSLLDEAGIPCTQRLTNVGGAIGVGMPVIGSREILVPADQLERAREVLAEQEQAGPLPGETDS